MLGSLNKYFGMQSSASETPSGGIIPIKRGASVEYMIIPNVCIHPYDAYYEAIAKALGLQIMRGSEFFDHAPKCTLLEKVLFRVQAFGLAVLVHFYYDLARLVLDKKLLYVLESCVSKRIAWSTFESRLESRFDSLLIENIYSSLASKARLERLLKKGIYAVRAVFVMDENYSPNYCLVQLLHSFNIKVFQLQDSDGLRVAHLDPRQRFFGDLLPNTHLADVPDSAKPAALQPHYSYMQVKLSDEYIKPMDTFALVVYAHAFDDAFHYTLGSLFRDQVQLLEFVASQANRLGLRLCVKWHPSSFSRSKNFEAKFQQYLSRSHDISFLPPKSTLKSIAEAAREGFAILTCYGSIIYEATAAQIPVIACANYSGDCFKICSQPKSKKELVHMLYNLRWMFVSETQASQAAKILQLRTKPGSAHFPLESSADDSAQHLFPKFFDYSVYSNENRSRYVNDKLVAHHDEFRRLVLSQIATKI